MEKSNFRVKSKTEHIIEVNDKGETISFDLTDVSLGLRLIETNDQLSELLDKTEKKIRELTNVSNKKKNGDLASKRERTSFEILNEFYNEAENIFDGFLGEGACAKIFDGKKKWFTMFNDLMDKLKIEFKKAGLNPNLKKMQKDLKQKYSINGKKAI